MSLNELTGKIVVSISSAELYSKYPFKYLKTSDNVFNNKHIIQISALGYGGGIISGDNGYFHWKLLNGSTARFYTNGTSKVFKRIEDRLCKQQLLCEIEYDALLCYLPDSTALFRGASLAQKQAYFLGLSARLVIACWIGQYAHCIFTCMFYLV